MRYDIKIKNAVLFLPYGERNHLEIGIKNGYIEAAAPCIPEEADIVIDAKGMLLTPGFIEARLWMEQESADNILKQCILHGDSAVRVNVAVDKIRGAGEAEAMHRLKKKYEDKIDILLTVNGGEDSREAWIQAVNNGWADVMGGCPDLYQTLEGASFLAEKAKEEADYLLSLSEKYHLPVDFTCCESDEPDISLFRYICGQTWQKKLGGAVTASHVTALDAKGISEEEAADAAAWCAKSGVFVATFTSQDMFLMSEDRRGPARVRQLYNAGVQLLIASGHVRDSFRPFGNCDLLEEALLTAQVHKFGTDKELEEILRMITYYPAKACGLKKYGLLPGCEANLVLLEAESASEALRSQAGKKYVIHKGRLTAQSGRLL